MALFIKGGRVIDPAQGLDRVADIKIAAGMLVALGDGIDGEFDPATDQLIEATGKLVVPGLIDVHCHLREPGGEDKETVATGTRAAARGGFTAVCAMPNTHPVCDSRPNVDFLLAKAAETGLVRVYPVGAITKGSAGQELTEMDELARSGCVAFSDDGKPVDRAGIMRLALCYAKMTGRIISSHCEDRELAGDGVMHEGYWSTVLGLRGMPAVAEEVAVGRDILLANSVDAPVHIAHVSTAGTVELIRVARSHGIDVTGEVSPHHLGLTDVAVEGFDPVTKVNPPLRTETDRQALKSGLADGTLTILATDHAPHTMEDKQREYAVAPFGIAGLETAWPVYWRELVVPGILPVHDLVAALTCNPARRFGLPGGTLAVGEPADVTVIDPQWEETVGWEHWQSKGRNNPFTGWHLRSWPVVTIVGGQVVMRDRRVIG
ncbi:MAG: dihydroorotase [Heliobacteriaceae bacterium]|nr:dihydroorotase [Heliobacteriaceae bacterium]MDD4587460.1 dihydroorotase [Heliobacteriaceae bacterium]